MKYALERLSDRGRMVVESNWLDVERLVHSTVRAFARRYAQNFEDCMSEAQEAFLNGDLAWAKGSRNSKTYTTNIRRWVWFELFDRYRTAQGFRRKDENKRGSRNVRDQAALDALPDNYRGFDLMAFLDLLSCDGQYLAKLSLDLPPSLAEEVQAKGGHAHNIRSTLRGYLRGIGWTAQRINLAFDEITVANAV